MKALLVVDIQKAYLHGKNAYEEERFIKTVNQTIDRFRQNGDLVVRVHHTSPSVQPGTPGWEFDERIKVLDSDPYVAKTKGNAFNGTDLRGILDRDNIDDVTICGLVTQNCIRSTCIGSIDEGYTTRLVRKGTTTWTKDPETTIKEVKAELIALGVILED